MRETSLEEESVRIKWWGWADFHLRLRLCVEKKKRMRKNERGGKVVRVGFGGGKRIRVLPIHATSGHPNDTSGLPR